MTASGSGSDRSVPAQAGARSPGFRTAAAFGGGAPAIRWINYMSDRDAMDAWHVVGPYRSVAARDADLARIRVLPPGALEYTGGALFYAGTMPEPDERPPGELFVATPEQVAPARTMRGFFALFDDDTEEVRAGDIAEAKEANR